MLYKKYKKFYSISLLYQSRTQRSFGHTGGNAGKCISRVCIQDNLVLTGDVLRKQTNGGRFNPWTPNTRLSVYQFFLWGMYFERWTTKQSCSYISKTEKMKGKQEKLFLQHLVKTLPGRKNSPLEQLFLRTAPLAVFEKLMSITITR